MDVGWSPPEEETNELIPIWNVERAHNETERKLRESDIKKYKV